MKKRSSEKSASARTRKTAPDPNPKFAEKSVNVEPSDSALPGKPVSSSRSEMLEVVLPNDANPLGYVLGGRVMHWIDMAGAVAGHRHSGTYLVTASVDYLDFRSPIHIGDLVVLQASVNRVFHTSMEVGVKVYSENILTRERKHTSSAYLTYVAVDRNLQRRPIPPLILETDEDRRHWREAGERREIRLAHRYKRPLENGE